MIRSAGQPCIWRRALACCHSPRAPRKHRMAKSAADDGCANRGGRRDGSVHAFFAGRLSEILASR